jgi:hypothetical protein
MKKKFNKRSAKAWAKLYAGDLIRAFLDSDPVVLDGDTEEARHPEDHILLENALKELAAKLSPFQVDDKTRDEVALNM